MLVLHPGETLNRTVRKHWLVFVAANLYLVVLAFIPLVFRNLLVVQVGSETLFRLAYTLWLSVLWLMLAIDWTNYYLDVWYLTSERLIDIEQKGLFFRDEATTRLELIQDVTVETGGFLATLVGFGNLRVQTAGESREFMMRDVAHPEAVKREIEELIRASHHS
jgi:uncharacterized membrane protein YdbT with pleckstrin-like domain